MYFDVIEAQYIDDYRIKLEFEDGSTGTVDLFDYLKEDTVFRAFQDIAYFKDFSVRYGTIVWGDGEVDIRLRGKCSGQVESVNARKDLTAPMPAPPATLRSVPRF